MYWEENKMCAEFWWGNPKEREDLENTSLDGSIIFKLILSK
jgi:hypothetical protein